MWLLLQSLVIFAVVAWNIRWPWTPNLYFPSILAALPVTAGLNKLIEMVRR
jgi:hypothetical protein